MQAKQLPCLYRHPPPETSTLPFALVAFVLTGTATILPTTASLVPPRRLCVAPDALVSVRLGATGSALRHLNLLEGSQPPPHPPTRQHQHHGNWTIGALTRLPICRLDSPSPESSVADERGREKERLHLHTGAALPCIASLHGLGARTTIWLSEALLEKELLIERNEREKEEDSDRARSEETAIHKPRHTSLDWGILDIAADLIASL